MPINFPSSPTSGSQYTYASKTWQWNGYAWDIVTPTTISTINGCTSSAITITGTANEVTVDTTCPNIVIGLPNNLVVQNLTVTGSLLVSGGITTQMSEVVLIEDNFVTLNANVTAGAPTENAGIIISRGASANVDLRWNETSDNWQFTNNGTDYWNLPINVVNTFNGLTGGVTFAVPVASATVTGAASFGNQFVVSAAGAVSLTSNYVSSVNGSTGAITITGAGAITYTQSGTTNTINARLASTSVTGVASFNTNDFVVATTGHVGLTGTIARTNVINNFSITQTVQGDIQVNGSLISGSDLESGQIYIRGANTDIIYNTDIIGNNQRLVFTPGGNSVITLPGASGTVALVNTTVASVNGQTGPITITGAGAILFTHSGKTGTFNARLASASATGVASFGNEFVVSAAGAVSLTANYVKSVNGSTGAVVSIATTGSNTFTGLQTMNAGLTTNHLYVSRGATFNSGIVSNAGLTAYGNCYLGADTRITIDPNNLLISIGDVASANNATQILVDDSAGTMILSAPYGWVGIGDPLSANNGYSIIIDSASTGSIVSSYEYFENSAGYIKAETGYRIGTGAINAQTGTSYTLTGTDNGKIVTFNNAATTTVTIPTGLDTGFNCTVIQLGAGQVGFTAASGLTMQSYGNQFKLLGQHASATVLEYTTNIVNISGNLTV